MAEVYHPAVFGQPQEGAHWHSLPHVQRSPQQQPDSVGVQGQVTGQVHFDESAILISFSPRSSWLGHQLVPSLELTKVSVRSLQSCRKKIRRDQKASKESAENPSLVLKGRTRTRLLGYTFGMQNILTLVSAGNAELSDEALRIARTELESSAEVGEPRWLAESVACDLPFGGLDPLEAENRVRAALDGEGLDLAAMPEAGRRKRLLVADMESTVIANEMLDELGELAGKGERIAAVTASAMRGELDFAGSLRSRVAELAGLSTDVLEQARERIKIDPGAASLVATMKAHGAFCALVSGGFSTSVGPIAEQLGFDAWRANTFELADDALTGRVIEPILGRNAKVEALEDYCNQLGLTPADAVGVGDGANDLGLLTAVDLGVAFHAKPAVAEAARYRVDHGDLSTLLYYQGYGEAEITG